MVAFDETRLRKAFDQPAGSLNDFIQGALGLCQFSSREQRVERAFTEWVASIPFFAILVIFAAHFPARQSLRSSKSLYQKLDLLTSSFAVQGL